MIYRLAINDETSAKNKANNVYGIVIFERIETRTRGRLSPLADCLIL